MSKKINIKELDFNNIGGWPQQAKIGLCVIIGIVIVGLAWWVFVRDQREQLAGLERTETELLLQRLAQMEQQLQQMLRQLPSKTEMPDLIVDISQTALATGISNELFQPGPEQPKEFYAEKPIALRMVGTYHQFGGFVSGVASLPRVVIMTMHDISLKPRGEGKGVGITANAPLELAGTVKTYRYLDEEEIAESTAAQTGKEGT